MGLGSLMRSSPLTRTGQKGGLGAVGAKQQRLRGKGQSCISMERSMPLAFLPAR